jgi:hypothetical protein
MSIIFYELAHDKVCFKTHTTIKIQVTVTRCPDARNDENASKGVGVVR